MRALLILGALFALVLTAHAQAPVITPSTPPVVLAGATQQFTATNGPITWTCPGCAGSISAGGLYTAPATIHSNQSCGGYQCLPNDHIYNTRVDSLSVDASSGTWITALTGVGVPFSYQFAFPSNYMTSSTPTYALTFTNTPTLNGNYQINSIAPYPFLQQESGIYQGAAVDRHIQAVRTDSGLIQELYDTFGVNGIFGPSAVSAASVQNSSYALPGNGVGSTDAAGLYIWPLVLRFQEVEQAINSSGTIKHALRMSMLNSMICNSSVANACGENAGGTRHIWPATIEAFAGGGTIPYGAWMRLKSTFNCAFQNGSSGTAFSSAAQILCTQLKQYGVILADGGTNIAATIEQAPWVSTASSAIFEVNNAALAPSNFEFVNAQGLQGAGAYSGVTTNTETVVATAAGGTAKQQVVLTGVTVTLPKDLINIAANSGAIQLSAYVQGSGNTAVTWTAGTGNVGTLTSGGLYTPPASIAGSPPIFQVTATSSADSGVASSQWIRVMPPVTSGIYTVGACCGGGADYTDSHGNVWYHETVVDGCIATGSSIGNWPATTDITLYISQCDALAGDERFDVYVPNGTYAVDVKLGDAECLGANTRFMVIDAQGVIQVPRFDVNTTAGGCYKPLDENFTVTVTTGILSIGLRDEEVNSSIAGLVASYNALSIKQTSPVVPSAPPKAGVLLSAKVK